MGREIWLFRWRCGVSSILIISVIISVNRLKQYTCDLVLVLLPLTSVEDSNTNFLGVSIAT